VLYSQTGTGTTTTRRFNAPDNWDLTWAYNCSNFGNSGNFQVYITGADQDTGVNQLGPGGQGVEHYHQGGSIYLEVNSECAWQIRATVA
jgi:hypothetical protein